jgi:hypothetical protein
MKPIPAMKKRENEIKSGNFLSGLKSHWENSKLIKLITMQNQENSKQ